MGKGREGSKKRGVGNGEPTAAKKKETTINQMTSFEKAPKAWEKVRVLVRTAVVTPSSAHAPVGNGSRTKPERSTKTPA